MKQRKPLLRKTPLRRKSPLKRSAFKRKPAKKKVAKKATKKSAIWSTKKADREFSIFIRTRDGKCVYPGCAIKDVFQLQCSHFWGRKNSATRYDPDNCVALCYRHHYGDRIRGWEYSKHAEYRDYMIAWLGDAKYDALMKRARSTVQRRTAIIEVMGLLENAKNMA